jgi:hypothetical protein
MTTNKKLKRYYLSDETRAKLSAANKGRVHSKKTKAKMSAARRRWHATRTAEQRQARGAAISASWVQRRKEQIVNRQEMTT